MHLRNGNPIFLIFCVIAPLIFIACGHAGLSGGQEPAEIRTGSPVPDGGEVMQADPYDREDPREVILHFGRGPDLLDADFAAIEAAIEADPAGVRAAALENLKAADPAARFAALYMLARTAEPGESQDALAPFLDSEDATERLLAAQALLVRGDRAAFPALIDLMDSREEIAYWDPPQQAWEVASFALFQFTEEDLGLVGSETYTSTASAKPAWEAWWLEEGGGLAWNAELSVFRRANP